MAKISALAVADIVDGSEQIPIVQAGTTRRMTLAALRGAIVPFLQNWYRGDPGPTGPANNTRLSLAQLKAAAPSDTTSLYDGSLWTWRGGDWRGKANDRTIVASDLASLQTGAWVRGDDARVIPLAQFFVTGSGVDETAKIRAWLAAIAASAAAGVKTIGLTGGVPLYFTTVDASFPVGDVTLDFEYSVFHPLAQDGGRFVIDDVDRLTIRHAAATGYTQRHHYDPVFQVIGKGRAAGRGRLRILDCIATNCGAFAYGGDLADYRADGILADNVGVMPRPLPFDPSGAGFGAAFERYGYVLRAVLCDAGEFGARNYARHDLPAGGASSDVTGGAGHFNTYLCNNFTLAGRSVNAPGQGFAHAGGWQGRDILAELDGNTFDATLRGQNNRIVGSGYGANQELGTIFGCGNSKIDGLAGSDNRAAVGELWDCWSSIMTITSARESAPADHPIVKAGLGQVAGRGAVHCINSFDCEVEVDVSVARHNAVSFAGSRRCRLRTSSLRNYGAANDDSAELSSGVECGVGVHGRGADQIDLVATTFLKAVGNTHGATIFIQSNNQVIRYANLVQMGGEVTIAGGVRSAFGAAPDYYRLGLSGGGVGPNTPGWRMLPSRTTKAVTGATTIYDLPSIISAYDTAELVVSGYQETNGDQRFFDRISASRGVEAVQVNSKREMGSPPARAYVVDTATGALRLTSAGEPLRVSIEGVIYAQPIVD